MHAIIESGGKQYRVAPGDTIDIETVSGETGAGIELGRVVAVINDTNQVLTGADASSARVTGTIVGNVRGDKVIVFKFKRKKQYKRTIGHRQNYTRVKIGDIAV